MFPFEGKNNIIRAVSRPELLASRWRKCMLFAASHGARVVIAPTKQGQKHPRETHLEFRVRQAIEGIVSTLIYKYNIVKQVLRDFFLKPENEPGF